MRKIGILAFAALLAWAPVARADESGAAKGRTVTVEKSSVKTPTGRAFTRNRTVTKANGATHTASTTGEVTHTGKGQRSMTSHTDRSGTTAKGKKWAGTVDRTGTVKHGPDGRTAERTVKRTSQAVK